MVLVLVYEMMLVPKSNQKFECGCRKVTQAAEKQLRRLWHTTPIYVYPQMQEYAEKLASLLPDPLKVCFHCWKWKVEHSRISNWGPGCFVLGKVLKKYYTVNEMKLKAQYVRIFCHKRAQFPTITKA